MTTDHPEKVTLTEEAKYTYDGSYNVDITDGQVLYKRSPSLEAFVEALAKEPAQLGEGVDWYDLGDGLDVDSIITKGLITRKDSRGVVDAILRRATKHATFAWPSMSFIIGSPGIGKTRTLTFVLRQLLQNENVNVQYVDQKTETASIFLRRNGTKHILTSRRKFRR
jgi:hypothetical protein